MAAEKKPRTPKATAETKANKTTATAKVAAAKAKVVRTRKPKPIAVTPAQIAERAYYIWAEGSPGDALEHWVQAERELTGA
jgi:hypothetical protein